MNKLIKIFFIAAVCFSASSFSFRDFDKTESEKNGIVSVKFSVVGDLMCHSTQYNYARTGEDEYDFKPVYDEIKPILESADFAMGNLETVTAGEKYPIMGYPFFNSPDEFIEALSYAGFDLLFTANNHSYDMKKTGIERTIEILKQNNLEYSGTALSSEEKNNSKIYRINGISFAVLAYTYGSNRKGIEPDEDYLLNFIETKKIEEDLKKVKSRNPDFVITYFHFGTEYKKEPNKFQKDVVRSAINAGADVILGSHPHAIQQVEVIESGKGKIKEKLVAYSLGNFVSNQRWRYSDAGVILNFTISKDVEKDSVYLTETEFIPTWVFKGSTGIKNEYKILPSELSNNLIKPSYLTDEDVDLMRESYYDTIQLITKKSEKPTLKSNFELEIRSVELAKIE